MTEGFSVMRVILLTEGVGFAKNGLILCLLAFIWKLVPQPDPSQ